MTDRERVVEALDRGGWFPIDGLVRYIHGMTYREVQSALVELECDCLAESRPSQGMTVHSGTQWRLK